MHNISCTTCKNLNIIILEMRPALLVNKDNILLSIYSYLKKLNHLIKKELYNRKQLTDVLNFYKCVNSNLLYCGVCFLFV